MSLSMNLYSPFLLNYKTPSNQSNTFTSSLPLSAHIPLQTLLIPSSFLGKPSTLPLLSSPAMTHFPLLCLLIPQTMFCHHLLPTSLASLSHPYYHMFPHRLLSHAKVLEPTHAPSTSKIITAFMPPCFPLARYVLIQVLTILYLNFFLILIYLPLTVILLQAFLPIVSLHHLHRLPLIPGGRMPCKMN